MRDMDSERPPNLRTVDTTAEDTAATGAQPLSAPFGINTMAELVVDLLSATNLVTPDKLALVRGRAGQGSLAQAIVDEGVAPPEGIARSLAVRYQISVVDLALTGVAKEAAELIPLHVLERVVAIPYALEGDTLRVAVADPGNLHGLDELRLATRYSLDLGVASSEDILAPTSASARRRRATTSRPRTASPTRRSSGSSTPSSSRPPRTAPQTSTSSRRRTRSSSASASTACSRRCSGSPSG
jgi:hypothetical protein